MLKSTDNTITKEQFTRLRDARRLIEDQFDAQFSLRSDEIMRDLYDFALRSDTNELFDLFVELHPTPDDSVPRQLNREQFVLLREARGLIEDEFGEELPLPDANVMDQLYAFALRSQTEDLFDICMYLSSRAATPNAPVEPLPITGTQFRALREAKGLIKAQFEEIVELQSQDVKATMEEYAQRSKDKNLIDVVAVLNAPAPGASELVFRELGADDFERLRQAKRDIRDEFDEEFSLHAASALDDLYAFALRSEGVRLFDLLHDLSAAQRGSRRAGGPQRTRLSKEKFMLLRDAREAIRAEFDETLALHSESVNEDLYQFALRSEKEDLFDLCAESHALDPRRERAPALPSKDEFRMLRRARSLVSEEFGKELQLQSDVVDGDLYRFAVRSEKDELFDLHTELTALRPRTSAAPNPTGLLSKDEFVTLRLARGLIKAEFGEELALDTDDVLDRLYGFALESESEELFDLHAQLNEGAMEVEQSVASKAEPEAEPESRRGLQKLLSLLRATRARAEPKAEPHAPGSEARERAAESVVDSTADATHAVQGTSSAETEDAPREEIEVDRGAQEAVPAEGEGADSAEPAAVIDAADASVRGEAATPQAGESEEESGDEAETAADESTKTAEEALAEGVAAEHPPQSGKPARRSGRLFGDLIVRAVTEKPAKSAGKKRSGAARSDAATLTQVPVDELPWEPGAEAIGPVSEPSQTREPQSEGDAEAAPDEKASSFAANAGASVPAVTPANSWYISTLDGRLGVRLLHHLSIGPEGELFVGTPRAASHAVIELAENEPVLFANDSEALVNDNPVDTSCELSPGDRISISGTVFKVEHSDPDGLAQGEPPGLDGAEAKR